MIRSERPLSSYRSHKGMPRIGYSRGSRLRRAFPLLAFHPFVDATNSILLSWEPLSSESTVGTFEPPLSSIPQPRVDHSQGCRSLLLNACRQSLIEESQLIRTPFSDIHSSNVDEIDQKKLPLRLSVHLTPTVQRGNKTPVPPDCLKERPSEKGVLSYIRFYEKEQSDPLGWLLTLSFQFLPVELKGHLRDEKADSQTKRFLQQIEAQALPAENKIVSIQLRKIWRMEPRKVRSSPHKETHVEYVCFKNVEEKKFVGNNSGTTSYRNEDSKSEKMSNPRTHSAENDFGSNSREPKAVDEFQISSSPVDINRSGRDSSNVQQPGDGIYKEGEKGLKVSNSGSLYVSKSTRKRNEPSAIEVPFRSICSNSKQVSQQANPSDFSDSPTSSTIPVRSGFMNHVSRQNCCNKQVDASKCSFYFRFVVLQEQVCLPKNSSPPEESKSQTGWSRGIIVAFAVTIGPLIATAIYTFYSRSVNHIVSISQNAFKCLSSFDPNTLIVFAGRNGSTITGICIVPMIFMFAAVKSALHAAMELHVFVPVMDLTSVSVTPD